MSRADDLKKLITSKNRRLQKLKEQEAVYGISSDPHITIEIENIEAELEELQTELTTLEAGATHRPPPDVASSSRPTAGPTASFRQVKIKNLKKRVAKLIADYEAASNQLNTALSEVDRNRLKGQLEILEREIEQVENELNLVI